MNIKIGYAYTLKNAYFKRHKDDNLLTNHANDKWGQGGRPYLVVAKDAVNDGVWWAVPLSSQIDKFSALARRKEARYGQCDTIRFARFGAHASACLIQNMCPIKEGDAQDLCATRAGKPIVIDHDHLKDIQAHASKVLKLTRNGVEVVFPDVARLMAECVQERDDARRHAAEKAPSAPAPSARPSTKDVLAAAKRRAEERSAQARKPPHRSGPER